MALAYDGPTPIFESRYAESSQGVSPDGTVFYLRRNQAARPQELAIADTAVTFSARYPGEGGWFGSVLPPQSSTTRSRLEVVEREEPAARENQVRLSLLARKYARQALVREEDARLLIATERVRQLVPRVTAADFEALGDLAAEGASLLDEGRAARSRHR